MAWCAIKKKIDSEYALVIVKCFIVKCACVRVFLCVLCDVEINVCLLFRERLGHLVSPDLQVLRVNGYVCSLLTITYFLLFRTKC